MLKAHGLTDAGPIRRNNEDCFAVEDAIQLYIVADGMGGHSAGEVASTLAVESIVGFIRRTNDGDFSWPYGIDPLLSFNANRLRTAIHLANRRVFRAAERHDEYMGMGTTIVAALVTGNRLAIGHAGDSRAYLMSSGKLARLTTDDSWAATILAGRAEAADASISTHPMRNVLTNVLGAREQADVHLSEHDLAGGEFVLLCSDGLHGAVGDETLQELVKTHDEPSAIVAALVNAALTLGSRDNVTAVVVRIGALE